MSHYPKVLLDAIFGPKRYLNEIIWHYSGWNKKLADHYERRHDTILVYSKTSSPAFDPVTMPWASKEQYLKVRKQKLYTDDDGREYVMSDAGGGRRIKRYLDEAMSYGRPIDDVWDLDKINNSSSDRLGYPTQKPVGLLDRIIRTACPEGGVVLDPFCGCGTTVDAAQRLGRRWIGIDVTYIAVDLIVKRLRHTFGNDIEATYDVAGIPEDEASARALFARSPFEFERWAVSLINAEPNQKQVADKGIDGTARFPLDPAGKSFGRVLVSVKGGKTVNPAMVRDLHGTVQTQGAQMGVLITLEPATKGVKDAIAHGGLYKHPGSGQTYPALQHVTVADLLAGRSPALPYVQEPYIPATRQEIPPDQLALF